MPEVDEELVLQILPPKPFQSLPFAPQSPFGGALPSVPLLVLPLLLVLPPPLLLVPLLLELPPLLELSPLLDPVPDAAEEPALPLLQADA